MLRNVFKNYITWIALILLIGFIVTWLHHPLHLLLACGLTLAALIAAYILAAMIKHRAHGLVVPETFAAVLAILAVWQIYRAFRPSHARDSAWQGVGCMVFLAIFMISVLYSFITAPSEKH